MYLIGCIFYFILTLHGTENKTLPLQIKPNQNKRSIDAFPDTLDWRTKSVITLVQDYSALGFVSAVVMVEVIESLHAIATGNLQRGSVARVIDCCKNSITYECIQQMGGICAYNDYPTTLETCQTNACKPFASFDTVDKYQGQNDSSLLSVIQKSTLHVSFDASQKSFEKYTGGIYQEKNCSQTINSYALQLVGYGNTEDNQPYWIARNSWGKDWGENGYIRILRGENICGLGLQVYQPATSAIIITTTTTTTNIMSTTRSQARNLQFSLHEFLFIFFIPYLVLFR